MLIACLSVFFTASTAKAQICQETQRAAVLPDAEKTFSEAMGMHQVTSFALRATNFGTDFPPQKQVDATLLQAAEALLAARGTSFKSLPAGKSLQVLPDHGTELGRFAAEMEEKYGVSVLYDTEVLFVTSAGYRSRGRKLYVPSEAIRSGEVEERIHHEVVHARTDYWENHGIDSLFHGHFVSLDQKTPLWNREGYQLFMSLDELVAYPDTIRRQGEKLAAQLGGAGATKARAANLAQVLTEIRESTAMHAKNAANTHEFINEMVEKLRAGKITLEVVKEEVVGNKGERQARFYAYVTDGNRQFSFNVAFAPLLTVENRGALTARLMEVSGGDPIKGGVEFDLILQRIAMQRLEKISQVALATKADAEAILPLTRRPRWPLSTS